MTLLNLASCRTITIRDRSSCSFFACSLCFLRLSSGGLCDGLCGLLASQFLLEVLLLSLLLGLLDEGRGDTVHIGGSLLGECLSNGDAGAIVTLEVHGSDNSSGSELVDAVADVLSGDGALVRLADSTSGTGTVMLAHAVDTDLLAHVDLVSNRGSTGVEPVVVIRGKLLEAGGLDVLAPLYSTELESNAPVENND